MRQARNVVRSLIFAVFLGVSQLSAAAADACCQITKVDARTRMVTAKENASGRTFTFQVTNALSAANVRIGAPVFANFSTKQISLDGRTACCVLLSLGSPASAASTPSANQNPKPLGAATPVGRNETISTSSLRTAMSPGCKSGWMPQYHGMLCISADTSKPAILLVHGLHQTGECWKKPSVVGYNLDFRHTPKDTDLGHHSGPNAGIYKAGTSDKIEVDQLNWFDYLVQQGFTVATWTQPPSTFKPAYDSATEVLTEFLADTAAMNPAAPPAIALVGHSRGGLIIHKLLREQGNQHGRIRWAITIHTPHHGSQMAKTPERLAEDAAELFAKVELPPDVKHPLKELALQMVIPLRSMIDEGQKELAPESTLITGLLNGDAKVDGVEYFTFGGTTPTLMRLYTWLFTPMSSVPQYKVKGVTPEQYFDWQVKAAEVGQVSPMLDRITAFAPEIKAGKGDSLVTDESARLSYASHQTDSLNHAEVLWSRELQDKVVHILNNSHVKSPIGALSR